MVAVTILSLLLALPVAQASVNVEVRISSAIEWIRARQVESYSITGFVAGPIGSLNSTMYLRDQALITLALSDYHSTHNDDRYDDLLRSAANLIMQGRTPSGRFYEYYDLKKQQWVNQGGLYPWEAYALAGLATSAYKISFKNPEQRSYWSAIESGLKVSVVNLLSNQRSDGAWVFRNSLTSQHEALTSENGMMLMALSYIGLFEHDFGSSQQALYYGKLSEKTAGWLFSQQVSNNTLPDFGGFPHSDLNSTQTSEENGIVLLGADSYYSIIGVLDSQASPTIWDARTLMIDWIAGFDRSMRDSYGGMYSSRDSSGVVSEYPKTTFAACWMLQSLADIWVNLGGDAYYADSVKPYDWIVGGNEVRVDMQASATQSGSGMGFYSGVVSGGMIDQTMRTDVAASAGYALNRAAFIQVPEFSQSAQSLVLILFVSLTYVVVRKKRK